MGSFVSDRVRAMRAGDAGKLAVLMATGFIDMVGALIIIPLLPFYAERLGANGFLVMVLISSFSAMQLVSAPMWGRVSDRYGRKPVLLVGLGASAVAYTVFAFASSYWLLLLSRLVQGAGGGTTGVIQAYVADAVEPRNRARGLGWLSAATNVGVVLGPLIGSLGAGLGHAAPGLIAAGLCVVNIAFAQRYLAESHGATARARVRAGGGKTPMQVVGRVVAHPGEPASRCIWIYAVGMGAFYGVSALIVLLLGQRFGATERTIGIFYAYIGALNIVFRLGVLGRVVDRLGEARTSRVGAGVLALGLTALPLVPPLVGVPGVVALVPLALVVALIPLGTALTFPAVTALLSRVVGEHERGVYMGVQQTYAGVARVVYPLYAGWAWDTFRPVGVPFWTSAVLVAGTVLLGRGLERYGGRSEEPVGEERGAAPEVGAREAAEGKAR